MADVTFEEEVEAWSAFCKKDGPVRTLYFLAIFCALLALSCGAAYFATRLS